MRDYEVVRVDQEVPNEFLFVLDDGGADDETEGDAALTPSRPRTKGAYYKNIERKMTLKKRRINVNNMSYSVQRYTTTHCLVLLLLVL